ncbi:hypothetical protein SH2C18_00160 [Clostridium sediminicola]|uniref:hypothetical protein n=1 Tax=Clostridium sediminicola TaxID=3114879 RepID=UPI0031F21A6C
MNLKEMKKDNKSILIIALILSIFNLPLVIYFIKGQYSVFRTIMIITIIILNQLILSSFIKDFIFIKHFKIIDNAKRITCSNFREKLIMVSYTSYIGFYYILLFFIMVNSDYSGGIALLYVNIMNLTNLLNGQKTFNVYKGDNYFLYGERLIENREILYYDVKTVKKYKKNKKDKITLTIHIKGVQDLVILDSKMAYKIQDVIKEICDDRFVEDKMKELGLI